MECDNVMTVGSHSKVTQCGCMFRVLTQRGRMLRRVKGDRMINIV